MHHAASSTKFRGRQAWAACIAAGLIVVAVVSYLAGSSRSSASNRHTTPARTPAAAPREQLEMVMNLGVAFGSTRAQVLARLGQPTEKRPGCWIYQGRKTIPGSYRSVYIDGVEFCFSAGPLGGEVMTMVLNHSPKHTIVKRSPITHAIISKRTYAAEWTPMFTFLRPPDWYFQQNS